MKHELKQLFCFATSGIDFIFNDSLYDQTDGGINGISLRSYPCQFVHRLSRKEMVATIWQRKGFHVGGGQITNFEEKKNKFT